MSPFGPTSVAYGNGLTNLLQYAAGGSLSTSLLCNGVSSSTACSGQPLYSTNRQTIAGQLLSSSDSATARTSSFSYDEFGRLKTVQPKQVNGQTDNYLNMSFVYDRYGNLQSNTNTNGPYNIPSYSWPTQAGNNQLSFHYDAAGNRLNDTYNSYQYDAEGNLVAATNVPAIYVYDALNRRVKATVNGVVEHYSFDLSGRRAITWDANFNEKLAQYYAGASPVAYFLAADGNTHFEQQDGIGTERYRSTNTGSFDGQYNDLPYGLYLHRSDVDTDSYHFALLDHDLSASSGIEHAQAREYSANEARWFSPDPYDGSYTTNDPQSFNRYAYARNSPLAMLDPTGLDYIFLNSYGQTCNTPDAVPTGVQGQYYIGPTVCDTYGTDSPQGYGSGIPWWILEYGGAYCPNGQGGTAFNGSLCPNSNNHKATAKPTAVAQSNNCSVPSAPSGVSVNTNIKFANILHIFSVVNTPLFYELVRGKGPMDYKQLAQSYSDGHPIGSPYADFGNFNYGAVGAAFGIPQSILLRAAGFAQGQAGTSTPEWGNWKGGPPYGDDPSDQAQIKAGYNYYQAGCYKHS